MWDALMVTHLFKPNMKEWNENFIRYVFDTGTANQILNTPLFPSVLVDKATWRLERNGCYSVRSAYRDITNNDAAMLQHRVNEHWGSIWKLKLPQKVKNSSGEYATIVFQPVCAYKQKV
jgi:hypothetical protein